MHELKSSQAHEAKALYQTFQFSVILRIGCNLHIHNRSQSFQLATLLMSTVYMYTLRRFNCSNHLNSPKCDVSPSLPPAGYDSPGSVLISPVPHQMMSYMNMGSLSRTELQLLNQLHCRRKRRHRTIFTDEQLEALEGLFQETKYPDVGTREQLARKVHLREEKVEVRAAF